MWGFQSLNKCVKDVDKSFTMVKKKKKSVYAVDGHWLFLWFIQTLGFWDNWDSIKMSYTFLKLGRYLANNLTNNIYSDNVMFCEGEIEDIMRVLSSGIDSEL